MAKQMWLTRDEAELMVDLLEDNFKTGRFDPAGVGADLADEIREAFGMLPYPAAEDDVMETLAWQIKPSRKHGYTKEVKVDGPTS